MRSFVPGLLAGLGYGACMGLALPPVSWWGLVFLAPLPLVWWAMRCVGSAWRGTWTAALGALPFWLVTEWWIFAITDLGYIPMCLIQSAWAGVFVGLVARALRRFPGCVLWLAPLLWTGVEFFRGELFGHGYAWALLAHPLIDAPVLAAPGRIVGAYGVGLLACIPAAGVAAGRWAKERRPISAAAGTIAMAAVTVLASLVDRAPRNDQTLGERVPVAVVQTNVPQSNKVGWALDQEIMDWERFVALARDAARPRPGLIVWPETMIPGPTIEPAGLEALRARAIVFRRPAGDPVLATHFADRLFALQKELGVPMLVGEEGFDGFRVADDAGQISLSWDKRFNSTYLLADGALVGGKAPVRYDKVRLTPFGETMPYISAWPWLEQRLVSVGARGMRFDLSSGHERTVFEIPSATLGRSLRAVTPICFEITVASHCRQLVYDAGQRRADVIVSVTNDGWFGDWDPARLQHLQIARWRALELGTPVVRAANTGISAFIDDRGRIAARGVDGGGQSRVDGVLRGEIRLPRNDTLYARVGDAAGWAGLASTLGVGLISGKWTRRRRMNEPKGTVERRSTGMEGA